MPITTTPSGGPQGEFSTYTPIYAQTLSATVTSVTLSNIPTTYTDLELIIQAKSNATYASLLLRPNADSSSLYSSTYLQGNGTSATSGRNTGGTAWVLTPSYLGISNNEFTDYKVSLMNYSNVTTNKSILWRDGAANQGTQAQVGLYRSTSPLTSLTLTISDGSSFVSGSTFTLYGIKAAATAPKATGGDVINTDGTYWYHAFKNSGTFAPLTQLTCEALLVAGGGAGGADLRGGGGAGGVVVSNSTFVISTAKTVLIGAGGNGGIYSTVLHTSGSDTVFNSWTALGGGGGNATGGSGGGAGIGASGVTVSGKAATQTSPSGAIGYGNAGGDAFQNGSTFATGGGGGSGGPGASRSGSNGGAGGIGKDTWSSWNIATGTGVSGFIAGGGGGGVYNLGTSGAGGSGGGGAGWTGSASTNPASPVSAAMNGVNNTGGGGGGAGANFAGGHGGSGLVIVRYAV